MLKKRRNIMALQDSVKHLVESLTKDTVSERVVQYVVDQLDNGKTITEILNNPYIKEKLTDTQRAAILSDPAIAQAELDEVKQVFARLKEEAL